MAKYNGFTNFSTWNLALWIDNDRKWYKHWKISGQQQMMSNPTKQQACSLLADELQTFYENQIENVHLSVWQLDLMNYALGKVNWQEIAEHILAD